MKDTQQVLSVTCVLQSPVYFWSSVLKQMFFSLQLCTCQPILLSYYLLLRFQVYKARRQLAAVDWNYHINRPLSVNQNGEARHTRKYNQRTKEWNTKVVKVSKDFNYIPVNKTNKVQIDQRYTHLFFLVTRWLSVMGHLCSFCGSHGN